MTDSTPEREADAPVGTVVRPKHVPDSSYQNYLFGKAGQEDRPAWSDSIKGRAGIRLVSRGIVGAAFFTIGGRMARQQMEFYSPDAAPKNFLQGIAKGIDKTFGVAFEKGITKIVEITVKDKVEAAKIAKDTMTFRQSRMFADVGADGLLKPIMNGAQPVYEMKAGKVLHELVNGKIQPVQLVAKTPGRSYGAEVVSFTFDFAMASIGDATTRNLFQVFDPNVKKSWLLNNEGNAATHGEKKHIAWDKWAKATAGTTWRIFSKNQGEDWAAAIPYAFQMKFQSKLLNSAFAGKRAGKKDRFDGHDIVFDQSWNGGAYRRELCPKTGEMKIVGDYQLPGAIDLHARFVGYNWYTLMFREGYDRIGHALTSWKDDGFKVHAPHLPEHFNPITAPIDAVAHSGCYLVKSFIKANMYMNPAVIPFWFLRTSQSKWRGDRFVDYNMPNGQAKLGQETDIFKPTAEVIATGNEKFMPYAAKNYENYPNNFETRFSKLLNKAGSVQYGIGKWASRQGVALAEKGLFPSTPGINRLLSHGSNTSVDLEHLTPEYVMMKGRKNFMHEYTDASISYTPYMFAKAELGLRVDDSKGDGKPGQMDQAIYKFMDNVASFNAPATWKSVKQMWNLGTHFERDVTMREGGMVPEVQSKALSTQTLAQVATVPAAAPMIPNNTVTAATVEPTNFGRRAYDTKPPIDEDKNWAQSVVGSDVNPAQILTAGATRH